MNFLIKTIIVPLALLSLTSTASASHRDYNGGYYGFGYFSNDYDNHAYRHHQRHFPRHRHSRSKGHYRRHQQHRYDRLDDNGKYCRPRKRYRHR